MDKQDRYNNQFMDVAQRTAQNSYARRAKVGAVLVKDNHVLACGWNGRVAGQPNLCEEWNEHYEGHVNLAEVAEDQYVNSYFLKTRADVVHAEANIIYFCAKHGLKTDGTTLYITLSPCATCALAIIQAGIKSVYYHEAYRDPSGLNILRKAGISVQQL